MRCSKATVGQICSFLACLLTAVETLAITPPPLILSSNHANPTLVNATSLDATIDPRFGFTSLYGETTIPLTPCFMNVVELLAQYAELDWLGKVRQRHGIVLPSYPQVEIAVLPAAPATSVEVRLIMWGMWVGVRDIIKRNNFHEAEFEVLWDLEVVAYIYFTRPMDLRNNNNNTTGSNASSGTEGPLTLSPTPNETAGSFLDISNDTENSHDALTDDRFGWKPLFAPDAKTLTVIEVFLTVMAGLKNAATHPSSDKVPRPYSSAALDVYANVQFYLYKRRSPRTKPPFFQYIHVIKALRLVPGFMLQEKRFSELVWSIEVSGVPVGEGYLEKGHYIPERGLLGNGVVGEDGAALE